MGEGCKEFLSELIGQPLALLARGRCSDRSFRAFEPSFRRVIDENKDGAHIATRDDQREFAPSLLTTLFARA